MSRRTRARILAAAIAVALVAYVLGYGEARSSHRLVRYQSNCVARGGLDGRARDLWDWPFRCSEFRRSLPADDWENVYTPLIALEEVGRDPRRDRPSICTLPPSDFPSQGFTRPEWCTLR